MDRKGISFTLTIVVAGVILLMTALSIITLGGSSISNFFDTIMGQQKQAEIRQQCNQVASEVNQNYCSNYIGETWSGGTWSFTSCFNNQEQRQPNSSANMNQRWVTTLSQYGDCQWTAYPGAQVTVTVDGDSYNCIDEGYIDDRFCPAN